MKRLLTLLVLLSSATMNGAHMTGEHNDICIYDALRNAGKTAHSLKKEESDPKPSKARKQNGNTTKGM